MQIQVNKTDQQQTGTGINSPVMRYFGGKFRLAPWIIAHFPPHHAYIEPFGGAAGVLMQKKRSASEVYNDLDGDVCNVFRVLRCPEQSRRLAELIDLTPYARDEFNLAYQPCDDPVEQARRSIIRAQMGFGSIAVSRAYRTGFRQDSARKYGTAAELWDRYPSTISGFCRRLKGVLIENRPALDVIDNHDRADSLFYMDPPYVHSTRVLSGKRGDYRHEMTNDEHEQLLATLKNIAGMAIVSGYDNEMYRDMLSDWQTDRTTARCSSHRGTGLRTEIIWMNPQCAEAMVQRDLFRL